MVKKAVRWLCEQQDERGLFGSNAARDHIYDHAVAALAMTRAYGLSDYKLLRKYANNGIRHLEAHRNPGMVWRYQPRSGENDTSVTTWALMAYCSAAEFGLPVNHDALGCVGAWYDRVTDPVTGRAGYRTRAELAARTPEQAARHPPEHTLAMTAAALLGRHLLGQDPDRVAVMRLAAERLRHNPPRWHEEAGTIDLCYWFLGTCALRRTGGRAWADWRRHLRAAVVETQRLDGPFAGSWDPAGAWGRDGGRVYSTALLVLTLQTAQQR